MIDLHAEALAYSITHIFPGMGTTQEIIDLSRER
jgi:hypothetical protein